MFLWFYYPKISKTSTTLNVNKQGITYVQYNQIQIMITTTKNSQTVHKHYLDHIAHRLKPKLSQASWVDPMLYRGYWKAIKYYLVSFQNHTASTKLKADLQRLRNIPCVMYHLEACELYTGEPCNVHIRELAGSRMRQDDCTCKAASRFSYM